MTTIDKYRLYCDTESEYRYVWAETEPTVCPSGIQHVVQSGSITIIDQVSTRDVNATIVEENIATGGNYQAKNVLLAISGGEEISQAIFWSYPISLLSAHYITDSGCTGDEVSVSVGENTIVGALTASVSGSETEIDVSSTVIDNIKVGFYVNITDGVNVDDLGKVVSINESSIEVETAVENSFSAASPTYVRQTVYMVEKASPVMENKFIPLGQSKIGASYIPVNVPITLHYKNKGSELRHILIVLEYLY